MHIDRCSTEDILKLIQNENKVAVDAVGKAIPQIAKACNAIEASMRKGGRLIYMGAGTSGRLGVLDAAECPPTYGVPHDMVIGLLAGGMECMYADGEREEDDGSEGVGELIKLGLNESDCIVGISAAGGAEYVVEGMRYARSIGCTTVGITSNAGSLVDTEADISIITDTGAEAITGSTRMKAGTAQKMVTNMLSTTVMIRLGMVYENMMINLQPSNDKLRGRVIRIVREILECTEEEAVAELELDGWSIRKVVDRLKPQ